MVVLKRKISITLEEETVLNIFKAKKRCTKSKFIEIAVKRFLDKMDG